MAEENSTLFVQLPNSNVQLKFTEWQQGLLYASVQFTNGDTDIIEAFVSVGASLPGGTRTATKVDSNLVRSGDTGLPDGFKMLMYSLQIGITRVCWTAADATDPTIAAASVVSNLPTLLELDRKLYVEFVYGIKTRFDGRLQDFPSGSGYNLITNVAGQEYAQCGGPTQRDAVAFVIPFEIEPGVKFAMPLRPVNALVIQQPVGQQAPVNYNHVDIRCKIAGLRQTPVQ